MNDTQYEQAKRRLQCEHEKYARSENHQILALRYALEDAYVRGRQARFAKMFDEYMARPRKEKKMLDKSKKYKVGSVVYKFGLLSGVWRDDQGDLGIIDLAMQQLYDDGLAIELREPFEKTITVTYDSNGYQTTDCSSYASCLIKEMVGCIELDFRPVANRAFDLILRERL